MLANKPATEIYLQTYLRRIILKTLLKRIMLTTIVVGLICLLSGCADSVAITYSKSIEPVGFWYGFWHGLIAPISFIISLFNDKVAIYAVYNNGAWYNFGFLLGLSSSIGGSSSASSRH